MTNKQITNLCRGNLHCACNQPCTCVCHLELSLIPPETTTPLPPQLHTIRPNWPTTQEQPT